MFFQRFFFVFLVASVRTEVAKEEHFCSCIQSSSPLNTCIRMQALTRNQSHMILIERDNLYEIQYDWIVPRLSRMYLRWKVSQRLLQQAKYYDVPWFIIDPAVYESEIKPMGEFKYFGMYSRGIGSNKKTKQDLQLHYQFGSTFFVLGGPQVDQPRDNITTGGIPGIPPNPNAPFSTILNGNSDKKNYLLQTEGNRVLFYSFKRLYQNPEAAKPFVLKVKTQESENEWTVYFASTDDGSQYGDLLTISGQPPFGVIVKNQVFLWDFSAELVYQFLYQKINSQKGEEFKLYRIPMRKFFICAPKTEDELEPDDDSGESTEAGSYNDWFWPTLGGALLFSVIVTFAVLGYFYVQSKKNAFGQRSVKGGSRLQNNRDRVYKYKTPRVAGRGAASPRTKYSTSESNSSRIA